MSENTQVDPSKGLAFFWKKGFESRGREVSPLVPRFVANRARASSMPCPKRFTMPAAGPMPTA